MWAELVHTLRRMRGPIIGWGIGLALYGLMMVFFYPSIARMENLQEFLANYPQEMLAFFSNITRLNTPAGYLDTYFFNLMSVIVGIFAVSAGAGLLASDEEKGILDLVLAHPISRSALFWGRLSGYVAATAIILLLSWLGWLIPAGSVGLNLTWIEFLQPYLPLLAVLVVFGALALLLSLVLPSVRLAGALAGALLVGNYLLLGLANISSDLQAVVKFTPLYYYQGGNAIEGLDWAWLGGLFGAALVLALAGWALFQRREIRVGGERGWGLPKLGKLRLRHRIP